MSKDLAGQGLLARVDEFLGDELQAVERILRAELASSNPYVRDVFAHVTRFRGKRLRPMLLLLSASAGGAVTEEHRVLAAVVEMIHTATLVHDDVLDEADTRRHVATVNARWNNETSVLFGDYLFTHAFHLAASLESTQACRLIGRATNIVCEGELSQIRERGNLELSEESYLRIIEAKTAELCALCCRLGGDYSGADEAVVSSLEQYGRSLGIAFQIADDLLDLVGTERETGKTLGTDLEKQKLTLPLIRLLSRASESEAGRIRNLLSRPNAQSRAALMPSLEQSGAIEYAVRRAGGFATAASGHLDGVADCPGKEILIEMAEFAVRRAS